MEELPDKIRHLREYLGLSQNGLPMVIGKAGAFITEVPYQLYGMFFFSVRVFLFGRDGVPQQTEFPSYWLCCPYKSTVIFSNLGDKVLNRGTRATDCSDGLGLCPA